MNLLEKPRPIEDDLAFTLEQEEQPADKARSKPELSLVPNLVGRERLREKAYNALSQATDRLRELAEKIAYQERLIKVKFLSMAAAERIFEQHQYGKKVEGGAKDYLRWLELQEAFTSAIENVKATRKRIKLLKLEG